MQLLDGGTDKVSLAAGWDASDVVFRRYVADLLDLVIEVGGTGANKITLDAHFQNGGRVEVLEGRMTMCRQRRGVT